VGFLRIDEEKKNGDCHAEVQFNYAFLFSCLLSANRHTCPCLSISHWCLFCWPCLLSNRMRRKTNDDVEQPVKERKKEYSFDDLG